MATIKLNKNKPASDKPSGTGGPRRSPVRGGSGVGKPRPTLAQAQAERAERQAAFEQRRAEEAQDDRRPGGRPDPRGPGGGDGRRDGRHEGRSEGRGPGRPNDRGLGRGADARGGRPYQDREARGPQGPRGPGRGDAPARGSGFGGPREPWNGPREDRGGRPGEGRDGREGSVRRDMGGMHNEREDRGSRYAQESRPHREDRYGREDRFEREARGPRGPSADSFSRGPGRGNDRGGDRGGPQGDGRDRPAGANRGYGDRGYGERGQGADRNYGGNRGDQGQRAYGGDRGYGGDRSYGGDRNYGGDRSYSGDRRPEGDRGPSGDRFRSNNDRDHRYGGVRSDGRSDGRSTDGRFDDRHGAQNRYGRDDTTRPSRGGSDQPQGDNVRSDRFQGDSFQGNRPQGDRFQADRPRTDRPNSRRYSEDDGEAPRPRQPAPVRQADPSEGDRLSKRMSELGLASRREADEWIEAGWVTVDGKLAELGQRVGPDAKIEVDPAARVQQAQRVTILLHKPIGYVSGQAEDGYEPASVLVKADTHWSEDPAGIHWAPGHGRHLAPAGRLDIDSTGLLVLTQDGRIARHLIGEESQVEKEYLVRVAVEQGPDHVPAQHQLDPQALALLNHGLELDGVELKPAKVSWANEDQLRFVLREGRKRQIRRMCELVGLKVLGLKRVRIGRIPLGQLPAGQWRYLAPWERF